MTGFASDSNGALVVTSDTTGATYQQGFLRAPSGATVIAPTVGAWTPWVYSEYLPEVTSVSATWAQLAGPSVTVVAANDNILVAVFSTAELKADAANAQLRLNGFDASQYQIMDRAAATYARLVSAPNLGSGSTNLLGGVGLLPVAAGSHTIRHEQRHSTGASTAYFQKQRMWVSACVLAS